MIDSYVIACYAFAILGCLTGAFSHRFAANLLQQIGLACLSFWAIWRITIVWESGWGWPHEWLLATALLTHSGGTFLKTFAWSNKA